MTARGRPPRGRRPGGAVAWRSAETLLGESGSGSVLVVGILATLLAMSLLLAPFLAAHLDSARAATAADVAALAAADTAVGLVPGEPCSNAARTAAANGSSLTECRVEGLVATVAVSRASGAFAATAAATAGPPAERSR